MQLLNTLTLTSGKKVELFNLKGKIDNPKILIIGVFHGEEPQGYHAIKNYFLSEKKLISKNNIYIIPCLNPDGMAKNQRKNANGVDLNRNFPTKNWKNTEQDSDYFGGSSPASEEETNFLVDIIEKIKPNFILTLHSPFAIVNYDGNAKKIAEKISEFTNYPIQADIGYPTPGSFGTYCGIERNIPTITLEFDENENQQAINQKAEKIFNWILKDY